MVVVPTEEHVVIEFANGVPENVGLVVTLLTLAGVLAYGVRRRDLHRDVPDDVTAAPAGDGG